MRPIYLLIASSILILDQLTKWAVLKRLSPDTIITIVPGLFSLVRVENRGIAFGLLSELSSSVAFLVILVISTAALTVVCYLLWKVGPSARRAGIALALILGGAAGNFADRIVRGRVVDFLDFYVRGYHWPAFNLADSAIVIGAALLLIDLFWGHQPNPVTSEK